MDSDAAPRVIADPAAFVLYECDLLDRWRLQAWLGLWAEECGYWVPAMPDQRSPYDTLSHIYDDRRLLETRVRRFAHAMFHAQKPPSRTVRFATNLRVAEETDTSLAVLCSLHVAEFRNERHRSYYGHCRYDLLRGGPHGFLIRRKRFETIDCDAVQDGVSIIL
jgi:benzoate/toluate 1,2-dioxygenase beta subunit